MGWAAFPTCVGRKPMKAQLSGGQAVATAWVGTLKLCCVLPALLSVVGVAGAATALLMQWLAPVLALISGAALAYSFHTLYVRRRGSRLSLVTTWLSAVSVVGFWTYRLLTV